MKMSVLYYTKTGRTKKMADVIVEGMEMAEGVEAKSFPIDEIDSDWIKESSCIVLGTPTYMASVSAAVKLSTRGRYTCYTNHYRPHDGVRHVDIFGRQRLW